MALTVFEQDMSKTAYRYDEDADVLYLSFGDPRAATGIQLDDWLIIRVAIHEPMIVAGMTFIGFKEILRRVNSYWDRISQELPARVERLRDLRVRFEYDLAGDVAILGLNGTDEPFYFDRQSPYLLLKRAVATHDVLGIVIEKFSKNQQAAMKRLYLAFYRELFGKPSRGKLTGERILASTLAVTFAQRLRSLKVSGGGR